MDMRNLFGAPPEPAAPQETDEKQLQRNKEVRDLQRQRALQLLDNVNPKYAAFNQVGFERIPETEAEKEEARIKAAGGKPAALAVAARGGGFAQPGLYKRKKSGVDGDMYEGDAFYIRVDEDDDGKLQAYPVAKDRGRELNQGEYEEGMKAAGQFLINNSGLTSQTITFNKPFKDMMIQHGWGSGHLVGYFNAGVVDGAKSIIEKELKRADKLGYKISFSPDVLEFMEHFTPDDKERYKLAIAKIELNDLKVRLAVEGGLKGNADSAKFVNDLNDRINKPIDNLGTLDNRNEGLKDKLRELKAVSKQLEETINMTDRILDAGIKDPNILSNEPAMHRFRGPFQKLADRANGRWKEHWAGEPNKTLDEIRKSYEEGKEARKNLIQSLLNKASALDRQIKDMKDEMGDVKLAIDRLNAENPDLVAQKVVLNARKTELDGKVRNNTISAAEKTELAEVEKKLGKIKEIELLGKLATVNDAEKANEVLKREIKDLEDQVSRLDPTAATTPAERTRLGVEITRKQAECQAAAERIQRQKQEPDYKEAEKLVADKSKELDDIVKARDAFKKDVEAVQKKDAEMADKFAKAEKAVKRLDERKHGHEGPRV